MSKRPRNLESCKNSDGEMYLMKYDRENVDDVYMYACNCLNVVQRVRFHFIIRGEVKPICMI